MCFLPLKRKQKKASHKMTNRKKWLMQIINYGAHIIMMTFYIGRGKPFSLMSRALYI